jgi:hypothetical protein
VIAQAQRIPSRDIFMGGGGPFGRQGASLGQWGEIISIATGLLQATPAVIATYQAKRAADRAKQDKERQEAALKAQAEADAANAEAAKAQAMAQQGLTPQGTPIANQKPFGVDPVVLAVGGLGILGLGAALFMALKK